MDANTYLLEHLPDVMHYGSLGAIAFCVFMLVREVFSPWRGGRRS